MSMGQRRPIIRPGTFSFIAAAYLVGADGKTLRPELADDSLHPNVPGYNIMADV